MNNLFKATALATAALALSACATPATETPTAPPVTQEAPETSLATTDNDATTAHRGIGSVQVALLPALDSFPMILAQEMGFFADHGIEVELHMFPGAPDRDAVFQTNMDVDGLLFDMIANTMFDYGGLEVVSVSSSIGRTSIIAHPETGIETLADLAGNTVLYSMNTSMDYILYQALSSVGLTQADVDPLPVAALPLRFEAFVQGQAEAIVMTEPFATMGLENGAVHITDTQTLGINPFAFGFRRSVVEERPDDVLAFYRALNDAVNFINTADRELFIDLIMDVVGYPPHTRDTLIVPVFPLYGPIDPANAESVINFVYERELIGERLPVERIITNLLDEL